MPPATQSKRNQAKRPGDLTGVRGQQLAAQAAQEKAEAADLVQATLAQEHKQKMNTDVIYVSDADFKAGNYKRIRVNYSLDDMTYGKEIVDPGEQDDNGVFIRPPVLGGLKTYSFEEGRWYCVSPDVAAHLEFLGYCFGEV